MVHVYYMYLSIYVDLHHHVVYNAKCFKDFARSLIQQPFKMILTKMANDGSFSGRLLRNWLKRSGTATYATLGSLLL